MFCFFSDALARISHVKQLFNVNFRRFNVPEGDPDQGCNVRIFQCLSNLDLYVYYIVIRQQFYLDTMIVHSAFKVRNRQSTYHLFKWLYATYT